MIKLCLICGVGGESLQVHGPVTESEIETNRNNGGGGYTKPAIQNQKLKG